MEQKTEIAHASVATALVEKGDGLVELHSPHDDVVRVPPAAVDALLAAGFRHGPGDPRETVRRLRVLLDASIDAIDAFVDGVLADGQIDTSDAAAKRTAEIAMQEVEQTWGQLCRELSFYPVRQGASVQMVAADGLFHKVDPSQVGQYAQMGWELVK
ncbi:MAG: hypothetical protein IPO81_09500 [Kouleothrix sp.]|nr:hypothetical protein [Kouleothrix sp.]